MDLEYILNSSEAFDPSEPTSVAAPSATGADDSSDEESICSECREVDWDGLVEQADDVRWESPSLVLRTLEANHEQLATSSCKICRILSVLKPQSLDDTECIVGARPLSNFVSAYAVPDPQEWTRRGIAGLHVCREGMSNWDTIEGVKCLAVIRWENDKDINARTITPRLINFDWLKRLAQACEENHEESCKPRSLRPVSGLKVIEASSQTIIEAPAECKYVALSYVWGTQPDATQIVESRLQNPPRLIKDALSVTTAMDYEYLWIDRYCIAQDNPRERQRMINQMDQIYENASLTIIDATEGEASTQTGLPGISGHNRRHQSYVHIHNTAILELPCGEHELNCSKWATRGWTYQEGYLSKRRLIFTPTQAVFICSQHYAEESVVQLLQEVVTSDFMWKFEHLIGAVDTQGQLEDYAGKLMEYSKRHLSHAEDSLNAFLGVLNLEIDERRREDFGILHISCGLVAQGPDSNIKDQLRVDLTWYHETPAKRRHEFPTWSWAGWGGALKFEDGLALKGIALYRPGKNRWTPPHLEWEISWKSRVNNEPVNIREFVDDCCTSGTSYNTDRAKLHHGPDYPKRLEVTCFVVPIRFEVISLTETEKKVKTVVTYEKHFKSERIQRRDLPTKGLPVLHFVEGVRVATTAYLDQDIDALQGSIVGLLFAEEGCHETSFGCILAQQSAEGVYERVGAIPHLFYYSSENSQREFPSMAFLDHTGSILNEVKVSAGQETSLFSCAGGRRTISLV